MQAVVGLGNPGSAYAKTRHNIGFWVIDALAKEANLRFRRRGLSLRAHGTVAGHEFILAKPQTFMNHSGHAVAEFLADVGLTPSDLRDVIIVHDDLDLEPGRLRLKARGGHGGHNGVLSIIETLGTDLFARLKIGVGRPPKGMDPADYVLEAPSADEQPSLADAVERGVQVLSCWRDEGLVAAMNRFNQATAK